MVLQIMAVFRPIFVLSARLSRRQRATARKAGASTEYLHDLQREGHLNLNRHPVGKVHATPATLQISSS